MGKELRHAVAFTALTMLLFGGAYHGVLWVIGRVAFPAQAEGSVIRRADGTVVGSALVAQRFVERGYVHSRPSAVEYDAASTGPSNNGSANPEQIALERKRLQAVMAEDDVKAAQVPSELITASGSGIDPDLPLAGVDVQVSRIAAARHVPAARIRSLIAAHADAPTWGFLGCARVNVLELNLALNEAFGPPPTSH
jgi:K+-transporting ATPase ATPase C chain